MSKTLIIILIVLIVSALFIALYWAAGPAEESIGPLEEEEQEEPVSPEQACLDSGGSVTSTLCCLSASDFPNTCLIGACGCSPENSTTIDVCLCPEGLCFDGAACVSSLEDTACLSEAGQSMLLSEAMALAQESSCVLEGSLEGDNICNPNTGTWWLGFTPSEPNELCNPACVVDIETREVEINWRCTGAVE